MRVCPECGYEEPIEWRPTTWKSAQYIDCCRISDLETIDKELADLLRLKRKLKGEEQTAIKKNYAYRLTKPGVWVMRRWLPIYKIQKWKEIPAEQRKVGVSPNQTNLISIQHK